MAIYYVYARNAHKCSFWFSMQNATDLGGFFVGVPYLHKTIIFLYNTYFAISILFLGAGILEFNIRKLCGFFWSSI